MPGMEAAIFGALWLLAIVACFMLTNDRQREAGLLVMWLLLGLSAALEVGRAIAAALP